MGDPHGGHGPAPTNAKASPMRLVILLAILAVLAGALGFDYFLANRGATAAKEKLEDEVVKLNAMGFDPNLTPEQKESLRDQRIVNPQKVHEILQRSPTYTETHGQNTPEPDDDHVIEYYCWWGPIPLLNKRHYLSVVYFGKEPNLRYNTHYQNTNPPAESLPGFQNVGETLSPPGGPSPMAGGAGSTPEIPLPGEEGSAPPGDGKGKKGKGKGGKGKGLPPPGYSGTEDAPAQPSEGTKDDSATKSDAKESSPPESKEGSPPKGDEAADGDKSGEKKNEAGNPADSAESKKTDE